ncbi:Uncharacterised protein (plasmid) [Legionella adelaidensis]|uniref:Uncharacterized protein n=1 Tax=Legionella adelaidensis TaxID=45056 RepID=A0A0W0R2Z6_9GAMM|nr:hypothetical protein [Legionella adelaidensis]KTC65401.1 hypothetical protein Lade_0059 [Legionella adelaidensis]VEH84777.1 Uncharacterised protein [Legionella adelaidensis]
MTNPTKVSEVALRAGALKGASELTTVAEAMVTSLVPGGATATSFLSEIAKQKEIIGLAVVAVVGAAMAIRHAISELNDARLDYDKVIRKCKIGAMEIPTDCEEGRLETEQLVVHQFVEMTKDTEHHLAPYFGIQEDTLTDKHHSRLYSVLPFSTMSKHLGQVIASSRPLDVARREIRLFLDGRLPKILGDLDRVFEKQWKPVEVVKHTFKGTNYLNDLKAPRFIMITLANLLWHLQHPVDPETGYPLSVSDSLALCREAAQFVNNLLNRDRRPFIHKIANEQNHLDEYVQMVEAHIRALHEAYEKELTQELNIQDVANRAHEVIRRMDTSVFEIVFTREETPGEKIPDDKAAGNIAELVSALNIILNGNPAILDYFLPFKDIPHRTAGVNHKLNTVIDLLIIFCHLPEDERRRLLDLLLKQGGTFSLFSKQLKSFYHEFVEPIQAVCKRDLGHGKIFGHASEEQVMVLTARRLIPLITLVIEDYGVSVDTERSTEVAEKSKATEVPIFSGIEQVEFINRNWVRDRGYYNLMLSAFITMNADSEALIDEFPKKQYRLTQVTKLLDSITELTFNYRNFLQHKGFQAFLKDAIRRVSVEFTQVGEKIKEIDRQILIRDNSSSRTMTDIIGSLLEDLFKSLRAFAAASSHLRDVVDAPDFTEQQQHILQKKLRSISEQYTRLFGIRLDTSAFTTDKTEAVFQENTCRPHSVRPSTVAALKSLIYRCSDALSFQSRYGHKGKLLRDLSLLVDHTANRLTDDQIRKVILELVRITASYTTLGFFHANYCETRSAKALINGLKDSDLNAELPLMDIIFGADTQIDYQLVADKVLFEKLVNMGREKHWEESAKDINRTTLMA